MLERNQTQHHSRTMKRPSLTDRFGSTESSTDTQMAETIVDALAANGTVIEIKPATQSKGMGLKRLLLLGAGALGLVYWAKKSPKTDGLLERVTEEATTRLDQVEERIDEGSETASERIEDGSERAGEAVKDAGEKAAERTEEAGEKAAAETDGGSSET